MLAFVWSRGISWLPRSLLSAGLLVVWVKGKRRTWCAMTIHHPSGRSSHYPSPQCSHEWGEMALSSSLHLYSPRPIFRGVCGALSHAGPSIFVAVSTEHVKTPVPGDFISSLRTCAKAATSDMRGRSSGCSRRLLKGNSPDHGCRIGYPMRPGCTRQAGNTTALGALSETSSSSQPHIFLLKSQAL